MVNMTFPNIPLPVVVEILFADGTTETITTDVRGFSAPGGGIRLTTGQQNEQASAQTGRGELALHHRDGKYDNLNPRSSLFEKLPVGTHIRISINDARIASDDQIRFVHELAVTPPVWEKTGTDVWVPVITTGILGRFAEGRNNVISPMRRFYLAQGDALLSYAPLEESSDTFDTASNLVPGTNPLIYSTGAADEYPLRPKFGSDDTCPGSAPLPDWPVIDYFGWSLGTSVIPHEGTYQVHCVFKVPTGQTDLYICEWEGVGPRQDYKMRVNASGVLFVEGIDTEESTSTSTFTATNFGAVNDGLWHVAVFRYNPDTNAVALQVDGTENVATSSLEAIRVAKTRPRPMYVSTAGDPPAIGLGHMAVTSFGGNTIFLPPVNGFVRERAINRVERISLENNVPISIVYDNQVEDDFPRVEADRWGFPDKGPSWVNQVRASGDYTFSVGGGTGTITADINHASTQDEAFSIIPQAPRNMDIYAIVETNQVQFGGFLAAKIIGRFTDTDNYYAFSLSGFGSGSTGSLQIHKRVAGSISFVESAAWPFGEFLVDTKYNMRVQIDGSLLKFKAWNIDTIEPPEWALELTDLDLIEGGYGIGAEIRDSGNATSVHHVQARALSSQPMGIQPHDIDVLSLLQQAIRTDGGFLFESPDAVGLLAIPIDALYNKTPTLTLDYSQSHLSRQFLPVLDRQLLHNDVTVQSEGSEARAFKQSGANSIDEVGRFDRGPVSVNTASGLQLDAIANWILHVRTWSGHRFPMVTLELQREVYQNDDALFAAAASVKTGDMIRVNNPPNWLPPGPIDMLVLGKHEEYSQFVLELVSNTVPYGPYEVATVEAPGGLFLPGNDGAAASTPDAAALDITGDIDLRVWTTPATWTPAAERTFISKYRDDTDNRSFRFALNPSGTIRLVWSADGVTPVFADSTVAPPDIQDGETLAVRVTLDVDDGASGRIATFYTASTMDGPWHQLGSTVTGSSTSIFSGNAEVEIGSRNARVTAVFRGTIHAAEIRDGIDGTVVANPDFDAEDEGTTSFTDDAGLLWTVNGLAEILDGVPAGRRDTAGSTTLTAFTSGTNTELEVATNLGPPWTTESGHFPLNVKTFGAELEITDIGPVASDEFTRSESNGWGTSTSGHDWSIVQGATGGFSVNGTQGVIVRGASAYPVIELDYDTDYVELLCQFVAPAQAALTFFGVAINIDSVNGNWFEFLYDTAGDMSIWRVDNGALTQLISDFAGPAFVANDTFNIRVRSKGGLHRFKAWNDSGLEPGFWQRNIFDDTYTSGNVGVLQDAFDSGDSVAFDNFQIVQPQLFTVTQAPVNGIEKVIPVGSSIRLAKPSVRALLGGNK